MVDAVNEMNPDIVLMGGDIFDSNYDMLKNPDEVIAVLRKIRSRYGTYGVYGNHDIKEKLIGDFSTNPDGKAFRDPRMASFLEKSGVRMLDDETVRFRGGEVVLAGRFDGMKIGTHLTRRKSAKELLSEVDRHFPERIFQFLIWQTALLPALRRALSRQIFSASCANFRQFALIDLAGRTPYGFSLADGFNPYSVAGEKGLRHHS